MYLQELNNEISGLVLLSFLNCRPKFIRKASGCMYVPAASISAARKSKVAWSPAPTDQF